MSRFRCSNRPLGAARASVALEFALVAPALLLMLLGAADLATLVRAAWHMERTAGEIANMIAQRESLREADFPALYDVAERIAAPFSVSGQAGAILITGLSGSAGGPSISWRRRSGSTELTSRFGSSGPPVMPVGFSLPAGETAIAVETYARVAPWFLAAGFLGERTQVLAGFGIYRPRLAALSSIRP